MQMSEFPHYLRSVDVLPDYKLKVSFEPAESAEWQRGAPVTIEFADTIERGGVFAALRDQEVFASVSMGERRRTVEWHPTSNEEDIIDIDAESLFMMAQRQYPV